MDKIITNLIGGVGNQMFQYAIGYVVAKNANLPLFADLSSYDTYTVRKYELEKFGFKINVANQNDIAKLNKKHFFRKTLYKDKKKTFYPEILKIRHAAYLKGYWQSEKYFLHLRKEILELFEFRNFDFIQNKNILDEIKKSNSISINLRLGDYLNNKENRKIYFLCTKEYYKKAIEHMCKCSENPKFFVFSDEITKAAEFLPDNYTYTFVDSANWQEDMYFMKNCKHNIVANSSFSWWAAWLNQNENKRVVSPSKWLNKYSGISDKDMIPDSWVKIEV